VYPACRDQTAFPDGMGVKLIGAEGKTSAELSGYKKTVMRKKDSVCGIKWIELYG